MCNKWLVFWSSSWYEFSSLPLKLLNKSIYFFFNIFTDYRLVSSNFYYSRSLNSLKYGCLKAYFAFILSSGSYVNIYLIRSTQSLLAWIKRLSIPVPDYIYIYLYTLAGKLISIWVACLLKRSKTFGFGVPIILWIRCT